MPHDIEIEKAPCNPEVAAPKSKREWALAANDGTCSVFPVWETLPDGTCACGDTACKSIGKHPAIEKWKDNATRDAKQITAWWTANPNRNIGRTPDSDHVFIDCDMKPGINGKLALLQIIGVSAASAAPRTRTPGGGTHVLFTTGGKAYKNSQSKVALGIDVRGPDGYVLAPGSSKYVKGVDVFYLAMNPEAVAPLLPNTLAEKMEAALERDPNAGESLYPDATDSDAAIADVRQYLKRREPAIEGQGGDEHTLVTIMQCRDRNVSADAALEILTEEGGWNDRCSPPWDIQELQVKIDNAYRYAKKPQGNKQDLIELLDLQGLTKDSILPADMRESPPAKEQPATQQRVKVQIDNEVVENSKKFVPQIIPGWLTASGFTLLVGGKRVGKTTLAADMIGRLINDEDFYGRTTLKGWSVCYIAAEDVPGTKARLAANAMHNGGTFVKKGNHHRFAWHEERIDLREWNEVRAVADAFMQALGKRKDILMVIDTYGKCLPVDQSDETATKVASANIVKLAKYVQGAVLVLGQPSREGKRAISGSGVLENDAEGLIWLQANDADNKSATSNRHGVLAEAIDMKNCESGSRMEFQILSTFTVADPTVRDQEGNRVTAGYASVIKGWNAKGKEIECPDFKKYIHPKADLIEQVENLDYSGATGLEGEARDVFEDGVRAEVLIGAICAAAAKAKADPDGFGVDQKGLLALWDHDNTVSLKGVPMLKARAMREHLNDGHILNRQAKQGGVVYMLKRRSAKGGHSGTGGQRSPELYIVRVTAAPVDEGE